MGRSHPAMSSRDQPWQKKARLTTVLACSSKNQWENGLLLYCQNYFFTYSTSLMVSNLDCKINMSVSTLDSPWGLLGPSVLLYSLQLSGCKTREQGKDTYLGHWILELIHWPKRETGPLILNYSSIMMETAPTWLVPVSALNLSTSWSSPKSPLSPTSSIWMC